MNRLSLAVAIAVLFTSCADLPADMPEGAVTAPPPCGGYADFCARHPGDPLCPPQ